MTQRRTPWPKRCPRGHTTVRRRQSGDYYCQGCAYRDDIDDPYYAPAEIERYG